MGGVGGGGQGYKFLLLRGVQRGLWGVGMDRVRKKGPITSQELNWLTFQSHDTVPLKTDFLLFRRTTRMGRSRSDGGESVSTP
jgi:hypothetical protein